MKKIAALILVMAMAVMALTACDAMNTAPVATEAPTQAATVAPTMEPTEVPAQEATVEPSAEATAEPTAEPVA